MPVISDDTTLDHVSVSTRLATCIQAQLGRPLKEITVGEIRSIADLDWQRCPNLGKLSFKELRSFAPYSGGSAARQRVEKMAASRGARRLNVKEAIDGLEDGTVSTHEALSLILGLLGGLFGSGTVSTRFSSLQLAAQRGGDPDQIIAMASKFQRFLDGATVAPLRSVDDDGA